MRPGCDNDCTAMGWIEAMIDNGGTDLHISHAPDADLDSTFVAFDHDEQECLRINGWQLCGYERIK